LLVIAQQVLHGCEIFNQRIFYQIGHTVSRSVLIPLICLFIVIFHIGYILDQETTPTLVLALQPNRQLTLPSRAYFELIVHHHDFVVSAIPVNIVLLFIDFLP
jgi:hypothetical protein